MHLCHMLSKLWNRDRFSAIWQCMQKRWCQRWRYTIAMAGIIKLCSPPVDASTIISTPWLLEGVTSWPSHDVEQSLMSTLSGTDSILFCLSLCGKNIVELKNRDWDRVYTQQWVARLYLHIIIIPTHATTTITLNTAPTVAPTVAPTGYIKAKICVWIAIQVTLT